jgi:hypothetical protein
MTRKFFLFFLSVALWPLGTYASGLTISGHYDPTTRNLTWTIVNNSGKEISGFCYSPTITYSDGSTKSGSDYCREYLGGMALAATNPEVIKQHGNGAFQPGASVVGVEHQQTDVVNFTVEVECVFYVGGTYEITNQRAYDFAMVLRKGQLMALEKANEVLKQFADSNPNGSAQIELQRLSSVSRDLASSNHGGQPEANMSVELDQVVSWLDAGQQPSEIISENDKRIAVYAANVK